MAQRRLLSAAAAIACALALGGAVPDTPRWYEILGPDGQLIGFQQESDSLTPGGREVRRERHMAFRVDGHGETRLRQLLVRSYDRDGHLLRFRAEQDLGKQRLVSEGVVQGGTLTITRTIDSKRAVRSRAWSSGMELGDGLAFDEPAGSRLELTDGGLRLERREVRLTPQGEGRVLRLGYADGWLDSAALIGADGSAELPQLGHSLTVRRSARPLKLAELARAPRIPHEMQASPYFVSAGALRGQIRYRFAFRSDFAGKLPETGEQAAKRVEGGWQLDVCNECGPGLPADAVSLERWRQPSAWIESAAPEFVKVARPLLKAGMSDAARMEAIKRIARQRLARTDYEGYLSARAAWARGSGDCTEDAVVLAALARAAGIPARVASGITYSRTRYHGAANAFMPHAWVVAWVDGRWRSYDISLEGFDASHIALSLSDGEPGGYREASVLSSLLDWQGMSEVRKRP